MSKPTDLPFARRLPFLLVAISLGAATAFTAVVRLSDRLALNPWEPAIAMEAVRFNAGLPIYESVHATHMYGPLLTVTLAGIFRLIGLNLLVPRIAVSICALALCVLLALLFRRSRNFFWTAFAVLLFLGVNFRTNLGLLSAQPDCLAILIGTVALLLWTKYRKTSAAIIGSIMLFLVATFFKQTAAALALVPMIFVFLWQRPLRLRELFISAIPPAVIAAALLLLRPVAPEMFNAIVTVPASIQVHWERAPGIFLYFIGTFPILFVALITFLDKRRPVDEYDRWTIASVLVLLPCSIWAICKSGGSYNSLLPAYFAVVALFVSRLDLVVDWIGKTRYAVVGSVAISLVIVLSFFVQFDRAIALLQVRHGDEHYESAVATARGLNGRVMSPQDPTIAYRASGYIGRSLIFELDKHSVKGNWPSKVPESLSEELDAANFVVQVRGYVPNPMFDQALPEHGFSPIPVEALANSVYTIWSKTRR